MTIYIVAAGAVGSIVFSILFLLMLIKGNSLKIPFIGMTAFVILMAAGVVLTMLGDKKDGPDTADKVSQAVESQGAGDLESSAPEETQGGENSTSSKREEVSEQIILDDAGIVITAKGLEKNGLFGANLKLLIENNSDKDVTVQARDSSVNGYMVETMISETVAAGKKSNDEITFLSADLEACGIEEIADMEFSFHIFGDGLKTILDSEKIQIKTSSANTYEYGFDDSGAEIHNEGGVRIVSKGFDKYESIFGPGLCLFIENSTDRDITVQVRDVSVNGFMVDTIFSEDVCAGKRAVTAVTIMNSSLEENGIEDIEGMELSFHVFDANNWSTTVFDTAPILVTG